MKKIIYFVILTCLLPFTILAGENNVNPQNEAIHQYVAKNIIPVMFEKRRAFDVFLTSSEQNRLEMYRNQLKELRKNRQGFMFKKSDETTESSQNIISDEERTARREQFKELFSQVYSIAENHKEELDKIMNDIIPERQKWFEDINKMRTTQKDENENSPFFRHGFGGQSKLMNRAGFLLMNPLDNLTSDNQRQSSVADILPSALTTMELFPNPTIDNQLTMNLSSVSPKNKLQIADMTGNIVFEKDNVLSTEIIPSGNLNNGIYFVRLIADGQVINKKFIVSH